MPVQLPIQAANIPLPSQTHDPATIDDVVAAKDYQNFVDTVVGKQRAPSAILPAIPFMICPARRLANGPDDTDSARADVYKTEVILAHGGQRMLSRFCSQLC